MTTTKFQTSSYKISGRLLNSKLGSINHETNFDSQDSCYFNFSNLKKSNEQDQRLVRCSVLVSAASSIFLSLHFLGNQTE